jgi:HK97 family phage major capsid protein
VPELLGLTIGTGGNTWYPVLNETNGVYRIFGLECVVTEHMAPLGDLGDIALVDLSQFRIALRRDVRIDRSIHVGFTSDLVSFRAISRLDAMGLWGKPFQPKGSAPTLSWAVTLEAR